MSKLAPDEILAGIQEEDRKRRMMEDPQGYLQELRDKGIIQDPAPAPQPLSPIAIDKTIASNSPVPLPGISPKSLDPKPQLPPQPITPEKSLDLPSSPSEMNPQVKDYLMKKFNLGDYTDENRKKLQEESKLGFGDKLGASIAALGAGFMGRDAASAGATKLNQARQDNKQRLEDFDKGRASLIQNYQLDKEATQDQEAFSKLAREKDPNSQESKAAQELAKRMGFKGDTANLTADQFKNFSPTLSKMYEVEQKKLDRQEAREERKFARDTIRQDKKDQQAKLSDKQVEAFTDLDNANQDLNNILGQLGKKSNWTGPVDGRIPDMLVGEDQAAWRSAVGKYKDAYRKAITGAGASNAEIARLESRLPSETDTYANFVAKAEEAQKELSKRKQILAENLEKSGKNVSNFKEQSSKSPSQDAMVKVKGPDGKIRLIPKEQVSAALKAGGELS